jgi:hypothetical protein
MVGKVSQRGDRGPKIDFFLHDVTFWTAPYLGFSKSADILNTKKTTKYAWKTYDK